MQKRLQYSVSIFISLVFIAIFGGLFVKKLSDQIASDTAFTGQKRDGGTKTVSRDSLVKNALDDIALGRIAAAFEDIEAINSDETIPDGIKRYFSDFVALYRFLKASSKTEETFITTANFIQNASVIGQYFSKDKKEANLAKAAIVPYFFIKNYHAKNKKQKNEGGLYKNYIDTLIEGRTSLDSNSANVICLYVYALYDAATSAKELESLKSQVESYQKEYSANLGENGNLGLQKTYLTNAAEILRKKPNGKAWFGEKKLKPYPQSNL